MRISKWLLASVMLVSVAHADPGKGHNLPPPPTPPSPWSLPDLGPAGNGRRLFLAGNCYGCHGGNGAGNNIANNIQGLSAVRVGTALTIGFPTAGMPSYAASMQLTDVANITAYLNSIGTPSEPTWVDWWNPQP